MFPSLVRHTIEKHRMIGKGDRVLVGVSGGADSVCLLLVLNDLGYDVAAAHLNHGLRGTAADEDEAFVKQLAQTLHVPFFARKVSLEGNIEAAGRFARKQFFSEIAADHGFARIAVAHTQDDRVETFLIHLFRGSGMEGLISMAPVSETVVRPLIEARRADIESYLQERSQSWQTDLTNFDLSFVRNRVRHKVIPQLAAEFNMNLVETLARTIDILEAEDAWMHSAADDWLEKNARDEDGQFLLNGSLLDQVPVALVRRVLRTALRRAGSSLQDITFEHIEAMRGLLAAAKSGKYVQIPGGMVAAREFDDLVLRADDAPVPDYDYELKIPGVVHIPELRKAFRADIVDAGADKSSAERVLVDARSLGPYVRIRNWKPGDYYRPVGLPAGKLKKLFQRVRIPRSQRRACPVFVTDSTIVWVASFPVSRDFAPGERSEKVVAIEASPI